MHKFIIQLHVLQWLFVRGLMRNKGRVKLFQVLQKERFFHLLRQASALRGNLIMWLPFSHPFTHPLPLSLTRSRICSGTHFKEELINLYWKLSEYSLFPHWQSRHEEECEHLANGWNYRINLCCLFLFILSKEKYRNLTCMFSK